ncbi:hypothetical protein QKW35_06105 [Pontibacterium granulatum]|nr:hypothetical protein [Pontibacterium granulatum]MDI3323942.1 hypothetical protein [Pontibacterium granulatum]
MARYRWHRFSTTMEVEGWYTVQSIMYAVVFFTPVVPAPFMEKRVVKTRG